VNRKGCPACYIDEITDKTKRAIIMKRWDELPDEEEEDDSDALWDIIEEVVNEVDRGDDSQPHGANDRASG
jgi:hypothetical protein